MICRKCKENKDEIFFYKTNSYVRKICKKCEDKESYLRRAVKAKNNKLNAVNLLGGKCEICGYNKNINALDFHHKRDKLYHPSSLFYSATSWVEIIKEINKCQLLCANCHREIHHPNIKTLRGM